MAKLDVGVGDEFPTDEIRRDEDGVVHHHHYYYRRRRPYRFLRFVLWVVLLMAVLRALHYVSWMGFWDFPIFPWMPLGYFRFMGTVLVIVAAGIGLFYLRRSDDRRP